MYFKFIRPKNELLKKYLEGFYIFEPEREENTMEYLVFPSNHVVISIYKNTALRIGERRVAVKNDPHQRKLLSLATFGFQQPITFAYQHPIREIAFCFKPLGFNHFLKNDLSHYAEKDLFSFFPFADYEQEMMSLLDEKDEEQLGQRIENYWLAKAVEKDFSLLEKALELMEKSHVTINQIADELSISRQHMSRLFNAHLCKSPSLFRKIARFRQTLQNRVENVKQQDSLTSLTYESLFYDQSHLIKDFKALTGMSPQKFFSKNQSFENGRINWFFPG